MFRTLSCSALAAFAFGAIEDDRIEPDGVELPTSSMELPSSCLGVDDGYQWMKMLDGDEYPAVHQKCSNEYMVIDLNEDSNVVDYFSSYTIWHHALGGPEQMDHSNWEEWWLPNARFLDQQNNVEDEDVLQNEFFSYIISPDCSSCAAENNDELNDYAFMNDDETGIRTAYHMTSTMFGCQGKVKPLKELRWDYDSYECPIGVSISASFGDDGVTIQMIEDGDLKYKTIMKSENETAWDLWTSDDISNQQIGLCGVYPYSTINADMATTRDQCNDFENESGNFPDDDGSGYLKPSIGNKGSFCVCVKPNESYDAKTKYAVSTEDFEAAQEDYIEQHTEEEDTSSITDVHELYQTDFVLGTYRIKQSGTYKIMEDITFDFNAGDVMDPSAGTSWWPQDDQSDDYPGVGTTRDEYWLGFIAGITVEADNVVIDLNNHEIAMSEAMYYQQRFFACIAIKSVTFPPDQGPGFFGFEAVFPSNVVIKDGTIGLSSHFGIHGHNNDDVVIENVHVHSFETHGIEMSYFNNLIMRNVEIGPSSTTAKLKGEYGYARWTVQALERLLETGEYEEGMLPMKFDGRDEGLMIEDVIATLTEQMDMAFKWAMGLEEYDDDDEDWKAAEALFANPSGLPYGAVMYGLFLNLKFANVFTMHPSLHHSQNAQIENLKIHDLHHKMMEYVRLDRNGNYTYQNQFAAPLDARAILGSQIEVGNDDMVWSEAQYVGTALTDALLMLSALSEDWGELGQSLIPDVFISWVLDEAEWGDESEMAHPYLGCNVDRMGHIPKGVMAIRMDGVDDVTFEDLEIYNLQESSPIGSELCGEYWSSVTLFQGGGNVFQNTPYYYGYTGNRVHGIFSDWSTYTLKGDISFHDFVSDTGLVNGLGMYTKSQLTWDEDATFSVSNFAAGNDMTDVATQSLGHPYANSTAKPVHVVWTYNQVDYGIIFAASMENRPKTVEFTCIMGADGVAYDSDFGDYTSDNTDCTDFSKSNLNRDLIVRSRRHSVKTQWDSLGLVLWASLAVAVLFGMWAVWRSSRSSMGKMVDTEHAPLLQSELNH